MNRPIVALTMGDAAGIGPEIALAACVDPDVRRCCLPVIVGDAGRLRAAAALQASSADITVIGDPAAASDDEGTVSVIDLGLIPDDLPWGTLSAVAGEAAFQYIKTAADLAKAGQVQAICTAPINKAALHLAGHRFPGHTELLAWLTGTPEVSMMLASPKLKVIHVTTHIGLVDAVEKIEPGLVYRTIRRADQVLRRAGNPAPRIAVCGINPHAGENGLFGRGEEEAKIQPAVDQAVSEGVHVVGPLPSDTIFYLAVRGDFDIVVAMFHDQGHIPVKVLGMDAGVNITVGLPVIRTSVDHGTAFDIAGRGVASPASLIEALRQAASMSARPLVGATHEQ
jgi:4-hydroxythreonine-4-phosphate dehydrogenase